MQPPPDGLADEKDPSAVRPDESFPRSARIRKPAEFRRVFRCGRRAVGEHLVVHLHRNGLEGSRLGLAVPRAVGGAVVRNRVKRRLRDVFRRGLRRRLDAPPGPHDLVVRARPGAGALDRDELEAELKRLLARCRDRKARRDEGSRT